MLNIVDDLVKAFDQLAQGLSDDIRNTPNFEKVWTMVMGLDALLENWRFEQTTNRVLALGMIVDKMGLTPEDLMQIHEQRKANAAKAERQVNQ